jgi:hypothetical protein
MRKISDIISQTFDQFAEQYSNPNYGFEQSYIARKYTPATSINSPPKPKSTYSSTILPLGQLHSIDAEKKPTQPMNSLSSNSLTNYKPLALVIQDSSIKSDKNDIALKEGNTGLETILIDNTLIENILNPKKGISIRKELAKSSTFVIDKIIENVNSLL